MKTLKYILLTVLIIELGINSCSKEDKITESYISNPNAVQIKISVNDNSIDENNTKSNPVSNDSNTRKAFNDRDQITISTNNNQTATYTLNNNTWVPSDATKYIKWENSEITFSAFYPTNTKNNNAGINTFTLPYDQSTSEKIASADYMTAITASKKQSDSPIEINFTRKTALLNIKISEFGTQYTESQKKVSNVKIYSANTSLSDETNVGITPYTNTESDGYSIEGTVYSAIVLPTDATEGETFITLTDGAGNQATAINIPEAKAGYCYTYRLITGKNKISIINAKKVPWTESTTITEDAENIINTPFGDPAFETAVITEMKKVNSNLTMSSINTTISDQKTALAGIDSLCASSLDIKSLSGIEYLTGLTYLDCSRNRLTELDISDNIELKYLDCQDNNLTTLIMPDDTLLTELYCYYNSLTKLDVSKNTGLTSLHCFSNNLTELDVSNNKGLIYFVCDNNRMKELNVSNNKGLIYLCCNNNRLLKLNFSDVSATTDYYLVCGNQTSNGSNSQDIALTLKGSQIDHWNVQLSRQRENTNVTIVIP